jgi:hypothetical protein
MPALTALFAAVVLAQAAPPATTVPEWQAQLTADGVLLMVDVYGVKTELNLVKLGRVNDLVRRGDFVYVALETGGFDVIDATNPREPTTFGPFGKGQVAVQLALAGEDLVAVLADKSFTRYDLRNPLLPVVAEVGSAPPPVVPPSDVMPQGTVKAVKNGIVIIEGGTTLGFDLGQDVAIYSRRRVSAKDAIARAAGMKVSGTITAVVRLERVEQMESLATLGRGDVAEVGDLVEATREPPTASLVAPHWIPFEWRMGAMLRPFLGFSGGDTHPVGLLADVYLGYYLQDVPLRIEVGLLPFGLVAGSTFQHNPLILDATLAFYSPIFEFGLGGGFSTVATGAAPLAPCCNSTQGTIDESLRIGALDGFNFTWHSSIGWAPKGFDLAMARGELNIPLATHLTLFFDGGGGLGFGFTDAGLRTYLGGLGGPGTVILTAGLGFAEITDNSPNNNGETVQGPSLLLGIELRL